MYEIRKTMLIWEHIEVIIPFSFWTYQSKHVQPASKRNTWGISFFIKLPSRTCYILSVSLNMCGVIDKLICFYFYTKYFGCACCSFSWLQLHLWLQRVN